METTDPTLCCICGEAATVSTNVSVIGDIETSHSRYYCHKHAAESPMGFPMQNWDEDKRALKEALRIAQTTLAIPFDEFLPSGLRNPFHSRPDLLALTQDEIADTLREIEENL